MAIENFIQDASGDKIILCGSLLKIGVENENGRIYTDDAVQVMIDQFLDAKEKGGRFWVSSTTPTIVLLI